MPAALKRWWTEPRSYTEKHWREFTQCRNCGHIYEDPQKCCKECGSYRLSTRIGKYRIREQTRLSCTWHILWKDSGEEIEVDMR